MNSEEKKPEVWTWFDHPRNIKRLKLVFYVILALLVVPDFFMHKHSLFSKVEALPGFYALFGFISCVAIILISKLLGFVLKKQEDYYDR